MKAYFGETDAGSAEIEEIINNHLSINIENGLKTKDKKNGSQIIVGIKGSGKTHLRKRIEAEKGKNDIIFNLDTDNAQFNLDADSIDELSGRLKNYISLEIVRNLLKHIDTLRIDDKPFREKLKTAFNSGLDILKNVPDAIDIEVPYASIDLKKIFESKEKSLVQSAWQKILRKLMPNIKEQKIYILIDDAEDVFRNLEKSPAFIEAVSRSIKDINKLAGDKIHAFLFLKKGIWRIWYESNREYDKVKNVIEFLQWEKTDVLDILTKRISTIKNLQYDNKNRESIWEKEFDFRKNSIKEVSDYMFNLTINGPRDIIELANEAKEDSGERKITLKNLQNIESQYSQDKLYGLNADFKDIYPSIHKFIEIVFNGEKSEMKGKEFQNIIELKGLSEDKIIKQFNNVWWFDQLGKQQIAIILYKIGFIKVKINGVFVHSIEKADLKPTEISNNAIQIHPAFRSHLGMK